MIGFRSGMLDVIDSQIGLVIVMFGLAAIFGTAVGQDADDARDLCKTPDFLKSGKKMTISIRFVRVFMNFYGKTRSLIRNHFVFRYFLPVFCLKDAFLLPHHTFNK
jgi:hypothetical protein